MYLLDTNICIYLMKNTYPSLTERLLSSNLVDFAVSAITVFLNLDMVQRKAIGGRKAGINWPWSSHL